MKKYVLGVDGGNTKTQYYLFDTKGEFIASQKMGTCSHEKMSDGFLGCKNEMKRQFDAFLQKTKISPSQLCFSVFGLAGADFRWQKSKLEGIVFELGLTNFIVENDGYLGLKAGSLDGTGVCNINGTGTVTVGINQKGQCLQIGGIGEISGDAGGGTYLARMAAKAVYDSIFRGSPQTVLRDWFFQEFDIQDDQSFSEKIIDILHSSENVLKINLFIKKAEQQKDQPTLNLLGAIGTELAINTIGCINKLGFDDKVNIVLAGSVWVRGAYQTMQSSFERTVLQNTQKNIEICLLEQPPAIGAIIWALEQIGAMNAGLRSAIIKNHYPSQSIQ